MRKTFYTFWVFNPFSDEMTLLTSEDLYYLKSSAFSRAKSLVKDKRRDIYVRKISCDSEECLEWKFEYEGEVK